MKTLKINIKKASTGIGLACIALGLSACANNPAHQTFAPATEVVTKTVTVPMQTPVSIDASFGYGNDPAQQILIACKPLHICTILLQQNEQIKNLTIGDSSNWDIAPMIVGSNWPNAAVMLAIKPKAENLVTDLVITTDKNRIYNVGLTTSDNNYVKQVVFYYPTDTSAAIAAAQQSAISQADQHNQNVIASLTGGTNISLNSLNFNYKISGDSPTWKPMRVFDDGKHTIIQFANIVNSTELPAVFVLDNGQNALVNFRKKTESNGTVDYIVDRIFTQAVLITGAGSDQTKVVITNENLDKSWF